MTDPVVTEITAPTPVAAAPEVPSNMTVTQTPAGTQVNVDINAPTAAQMAAPTEVQNSWLKSVPADYADKPWVQELAKQENPLTAMFEQYANAQTLIGKKGDGLKVPAADAPAEQWQEFHKALGVPEKPEDYTYEAPTPPEGLEQFYQTDEKLLQTMRQAAHKAGVTPQGWQEIIGAFNGYYGEALKESVTQVNAQIQATEETFKKHYGEKSPAVLSNLDKAASTAPDWAKPIFEALAPATKAAVASVLHNFQTKYVSEDKLDMGNMSSTKSMNQTEYGDAYEKAFAKVHETRKNPHSAEHLRAKQELAQVRAMGAEIFKAG